MSLPDLNRARRGEGKSIDVSGIAYGNSNEFRFNLERPPRGAAIRTFCAFEQQGSQQRVEKAFRSGSLPKVACRIRKGNDFIDGAFLAIGVAIDTDASLRRLQKKAISTTESEFANMNAKQKLHPLIVSSDRLSRGTARTIRAAYLLVFVLGFPTEDCRSNSYPFEWAKRAGGKTIDAAGGVTVDDAGNCYVTGTFTDTARFDAISSTSSGSGDVFLAKYDSAGVLQWVRQAGGVRNDEGHGVVVDRNGDVLVTGIFRGAATFGSFSISGDQTAFVTKYSNSGEVLWVRKIGGPGETIPHAIAVDRTGNSFVTGYLLHGDVFISKLTPQGSVEWETRVGGAGLDQANGIGVDSSGNCYVTGLYNDVPTVFSGLTLTNAGRFDMFLAKYDTTGRIQWAKRAGAKGTDGGYGIAVTSTGDSYVAGRFEGTVDFGGITLISKGGISAFTAKYNSDGQAVWAREIGPGQNIGTGVALDQDENCYVIGALLGGHFDSVALASEPGIFLVKYDNTGNLKWAQAAVRADYGAPSLAVDKSGASYLTGGFHSAASFGDITLVGEDFDVFVAKRASKVPPVVRKHPEGGTVVSGSSAALAVEALGPIPLSFQWTKDGQTLIGQTNRTLVLNSAGPHDAGSFAVTVSNSDGSVISLPASLDVRDIAVLINGRIFTGPQHVSERSVQVSIQSGFKNGLVFYSVDGAPASFASKEYTGPFNIDRSTVVRAIVYSQDFSKIQETEPMAIVIPKLFSLVTQSPGGGQFVIDPQKPNYTEQSLVRITAIPHGGWSFMAWRGDVFSTNATITVLMDRDKSIDGIFGTRISRISSGAGSIVLNPDASMYPFGSTLQLVAVPDDGHQLALWGNPAVGIVNPVAFTISTPAPTVSCLFSPLPTGRFSVIGIPVGNGSVSINTQSRNYAAGDKVTFVATPDRDQQFVAWTGTVNTTQNPLQLTISTNIKLIATFTQSARLSMRAGNGVREIVLSGGLGSRYRIDGSTNLTDWVPLGVIHASTGVASFADPMGLLFPWRLYRATSVEP